MMRKEYPLMLYKTRDDYKIAQNIDEHEKLADEGYAEFKVAILGIKPEGVEEPYIESNIPEDLSEEYEKETGKRAFYAGKETKPFIKWKESK